MLKLENLLCWSFFTFIYNCSSKWIISYILHQYVMSCSILRNFDLKSWVKMQLETLFTIRTLEQTSGFMHQNHCIWRYRTNNIWMIFLTWYKPCSQWNIKPFASMYHILISNKWPSDVSQKPRAPRGSKKIMALIMPSHSKFLSLVHFLYPKFLF